MDNNKKQQQTFTRSINAKTSVLTETNRKTTDQQIKLRTSRRREQLSTSRNEQQQQRNSKQQQQSGKLRSNVDRRPRPRATTNVNTNNNAANNDIASCSRDDNACGGTRLALAIKHKGEEQFDYELNSVYAPGSKKQNLNHLLNFHYTPYKYDYDNYGAQQRYHHHGGGSGIRKQRYNKEQFLQANFQFVIRSNAKPQMSASPDTLIDWLLIEQINIRTTEEPQCPICLYPPVAAKLTRCGHVYCWPCLLHYLSLSDKTWRKCPICYEAIHATDLKSCSIMQQKAINVGDQITFQLMRRRRGSMFIERYKAAQCAVERFPLMSKNDEALRYSKFLIARRADIVELIERERRELMAEKDLNCPEYVFIQQALLMLNERREKLGVNDKIKGIKVAEDEEEEEKFDDKVNFIDAKIVDKEVVKSQENENMNLSNNNVEAKLNDVIDESSVNVTPDLKYYYFYQSNDGQNIYLHPLNVKMLQACYGSLDNAPLCIEARVLQKEHHSMDEEYRRKFTCLSHLPLTCQFAIVEVDLQPPIVSVCIIKLFKTDLKRRQRERQRREMEELKREKHINELHDRQMGKLIASTANINIGSAYEFPTCGFEETLPALGAESLSAPINTTVSYSSIAVVTDSPKPMNWPPIGSDSPTTSKITNIPATSRGAWGRTPPTPSQLVATNTAKYNADHVNEMELRPMATCLGDVLAEAISLEEQKVVNKVAISSKKQKKSRKMTPILATRMNYNGN